MMQIVFPESLNLSVQYKTIPDCWTPWNS